jgi:hypothetical protein
MENVTEVVALLRKQAELESQIENGDTASAVDAEQELERTRRPSLRLESGTAHRACPASLPRYRHRSGCDGICRTSLIWLIAGLGAAL